MGEYLREKVVFSTLVWFPAGNSIGAPAKRFARSNSASNEDCLRSAACRKHDEEGLAEAATEMNCLEETSA